MYLSAHRLFLYLAIPFGLLLAFLTPPFGGGDEQHHFQRTYEIYTGQWLGHSIGPAGISHFQDDGMNALDASLKAGNYGWQRLSTLSNIELQSGNNIKQFLNPMFIGQFPLAHLLYLPGMAVGISLDMKPLAILYLCRITGMLLTTLLIYTAIKHARIGGYVLCAIALLPTAAFYRSFMHTDGLTMGLVFLLFAYLSELLMREERTIRCNDILPIAFITFLLAPLKAGYALIAFLSLLLPKNSFGNAKQYWCSQALIILPGLAVTAVWLTIVSHAMNGIAYSSQAGEHVNPPEQLQFILAHPLQFLQILFSYIFSITHMLQWIQSGLGELGWSALYLNPIGYSLLLVGLYFTVKNEPSRLNNPFMAYQKILASLVFLGTILLILLLIYLAFNPVGSDQIVSFQGRYFLPILPLFLWFLRPNATPTARNAALAAGLTGFFGLLLACARLGSIYFF